MMLRRGNPHAVRILVVDDEPVVVDFAQRVLQTAGYQIVTATSGAAALKLCEQEGAPDLLVTDMKMPRMEGDDFKNKQVLWDGEAYLEKPCTIGGLLEAVSLLLSGEVSSEPLDT